ncbi:uncharacterized protein [Dysidea avara]|uniref:uncharacterized protein isoform X2 n=1 Tax=Dysidea avara TaxID=196820 RepID=UPI00331951BE
MELMFFEKYYQAIISSLPMKDVTFLAELQRRYLLFDHIRTVLQSLSTSKEMASYLVDNVIKPGLNNDIMNTFDKLLLVMEGSSFDNVSKLGTVVNKELTAELAKKHGWSIDAANTTRKFSFATNFYYPPAPETLREFENRLMQTLPVDDVVFLGNLSFKEIITDDELDALQSDPTPSEQTAILHQFLDKMISCENFHQRLERLLVVMEEYSSGYDDEIKKLSNQIRKRMHIRNDYVGEAARKGVQKALCWIKKPTKKTLAIGFIGYVKLHGKPSYVLVTNCYVLDSEEVAVDSVIGFDGSDEQLNIKDLMVTNSYSSSGKKMMAVLVLAVLATPHGWFLGIYLSFYRNSRVVLDFAMIEIDWNKLKGHAQFIDLTKPVSVKKGDFITVIQYDSEELKYSSSECFLAGCLLIYKCGLRQSTSGGLVVKAVDGNFEVVGLHRGKFDKGFNCGTTFKDITKCISGKVYNADVNSLAKTKIAGMKDIKSMKKGQGHIPVSESARRQVIRAVCVIRAHGKDGKEMMGTGFFGSMQLSDKFSVVLVTNYHVIGDEEVAGRSILEFEGVDVQLELKELMVETTFVCSDMKKLDYAMIEIDWSKLKQKHPVAEYIHLSEPAAIDNHDYITIIQHPGGGELSFSSSTCIAYEYLLLYTSETACGSSGGPILKATKDGLEIVGLHRGGHEDHYNYGSKFSEILLSISENKNHEEKSPKDHAVIKYYRRVSSEQGK